MEDEKRFKYKKINKCRNAEINLVLRKWYKVDIFVKRMYLFILK